MHVSKIKMKRGISKGKKNPLFWKEGEIEVTLTEQDNPEDARQLAETYLEAWLNDKST